MYRDLRHEKVIYQNPFLSMRIWQSDVDFCVPDEIQTNLEHDWKYKENFEWHYHEEVEFLLILEGELTAFYTEGKMVLQKGDVALLGSSEPHVTIISKNGMLSYIIFQIDLRKYWDLSILNSMRHFSEVIRPLSALNYVYRENKEVRAATGTLIHEIYHEMNSKQIGYELAVSSRIKSILLLLLRHDRQLQLNYYDNRLLDRIQPAIDYVESNLTEKLPVTELSRLLNMSYTHFIKTFKKAVGMSFTDFIAYKRIKKAEQQLLTNNDASIAEIAESVGINNLGHFYELFRRFNDCSPKQFKDRLRNVTSN